MEEQRSEVVDRLLTKLLDKHATLGVSSAPVDSIPARHAFAALHNTSDENSQRIRDPKLARLVEQLSCSETSSECHQRRAAALQARIFQMETEAIAARSARRRAEQEAATAKAEIVSLRNATSLHQTDHEREVAHLRAQLAARTEEATALEKDLRRTTTELGRVRAEGERQRENHLATERSLRERTTSAERRCESIDVALRAAESRASELVAAHQGAMQARLEADREAAIAREQLSESRRDARSLQEELLAAKEQLESCLAWDGRRSAAEEAVKEGAAQRATLAEECRGLRREVGRLESALMEERANRERVAQQAEHKLAAAAHEAASIRAKLEFKSETARATDAQIAAVRIDAERMAEAHQVTVTALKGRLAEAQRALEETRKRAAKELEATEAKNQEKIVAAVEAAISRHQRRIQDLELQLAHIGAPAAGMPDGGHAGGVPGGFAASVLDYIPRSEHLRLMEARGTAREAECRTQIAAVRAEALENCRLRVDAISKELHIARAELEGAKQDALNMKLRAEKADHALYLLQVQYMETETQLERARAEKAELGEKAELERAQLTKSLDEAQRSAILQAKEVEEASYSLKKEKETREKAESAAAAAAKRCSELEANVALAEGRCDDLATALERVHDQLNEAQHEKARLQKLNVNVAGRLQKVQHRCAEVEAQAAGALKQAANARADAEKTKAAAMRACEETSIHSQNVVLSLLTQIDTCLGIPPGGGTAAADGNGNGSSIHQMQANTVDARIGVTLSRCREVHAEAASQALAAQRAQQDAGALANALSACQARCAAAEAACQAIQERYDGDLEALERAARDQVHSVRTRAEEAIAGVRRASTKLQERLSMHVARAGSLAEEVEVLKTRLAQQTEQADKVEGREKAVATLLEQLVSSVGAQSYGGGGEAVVGGASGTADKEKLI